jgi:hypothetical protein
MICGFYSCERFAIFVRRVRPKEANRGEIYVAVR